MNTNILHRSLMGSDLGDMATPCYFEAVSGTVILLMTPTSTLDTLKYSYDAKTWNTYKSQSSITLSEGSRVYFMGSATFKEDVYGIGFFTTSGGQVHIGGNSMSLIYDSGFFGQSSLAGLDYAFYNLFNGCSSLVSVSPTLLPATTLSTLCYASAFAGCSLLKVAPILPAPALARYCYMQMFAGCSSLNYIKMLATSQYDGSGEMTLWTDGVASSGTFVKHPNNTWITTGTSSGIPSGWTVQTATK